jgi:putative transposase
VQVEQAAEIARPRAGKRKAEAKRLDEAIHRQFDAHKGRYGAPRVTEELKAEGWRVGRPRVAKRMQVLGLRARAAGKYKATPRSKHNLPVAPNRLEQDFTAGAPNQTWVSDIPVDGRGLTVFGGGVGLVFPCGGGLVHGGADDP